MWSGWGELLGLPKLDLKIANKVSSLAFTGRSLNSLNPKIFLNYQVAFRFQSIRA